MVDIFDALTTARPYKPAFSHAAAIRALRDEVAIGWRDARVVETFIELVERNSLSAVPPAKSLDTSAPFLVDCHDSF